MGFSTIQDIENKVKNKNLALRKKARIRIAEKMRNAKN